MSQYPGSNPSQDQPGDDPFASSNVNPWDQQPQQGGGAESARSEDAAQPPGADQPSWEQPQNNPQEQGYGSYQYGEQDQNRQGYGYQQPADQSQGYGSQYPDQSQGYGYQQPGNQPAYGGAAYQQGYAPMGYGAGSPYSMVPDHPKATTAMVLGIVGLASIPLCGGLLLLLSPFAWVMGRKAVQEIDASNGQLDGRTKANTGAITGMIGTILLILAVVALILIIILAVVTGSSTSSSSSF